jgi:hypothetical protein
MTNGISKRLFLIVVPVLFYYLFSHYSMLEPYAPAPKVVGVQIGLFLLLVTGYVYFGFIFKWPSREKTGWQLLAERIPTKKGKVLKFITIVTLIPIFFGAVVWVMERWLAYPTKIFAQENITVRIDCVSKKTWGKSVRGLVMINGFRHDNKEVMRFPWPAKTAPACPGSITVIGKVWMFGIYVDEVRC